MIITMKTMKNDNLAFSELYAMRFTFLIGAGLLGLAGLIYCLITKAFDARIFTGIISGTVISGLNFYLLAYLAEKTLKRKSAAKAQRTAFFWYSARFLGLAGVYTLLFSLNLVNVFTALIPLFFPKIHYFMTIVLNNKGGIS